MVSALSENARDLNQELSWFAQVLQMRLKRQGESESSSDSLWDIKPPGLGHSYYAQFVQHYALSVPERLLLILALVPHVRPQLLDSFWMKNPDIERGFTEYGGWHSTTHSGFLPTGETAVFLIGGNDLETRFEVMRLFEGDHFFARHGVLSLAPVASGEPRLGGALMLGQEYSDLLTTGIERKPTLSGDFPAARIETERPWEELVLPASTLDQLEEIKQWVLYGQQLLDDWGMDTKLSPGFTGLFYGPPGTGKTLSACLLGKQCGCDVYKIDLSRVVSKYIGETEKKLAGLFERAEHKRWILFFDEADALFGKRTKVDDAHDRYANQETSFLLQRIETFHGVAILASNTKNNIDDAFLRRFQSVIAFPMPKPADRLRIWENAFSPKARLEDQIQLGRVAERYDLSGGAIMNVVRYASLKALSRNETAILLEDLEEGIRRELLKEGRSL